MSSFIAEKKHDSLILFFYILNDLLEKIDCLSNKTDKTYLPIWCFFPNHTLESHFCLLIFWSLCSGQEQWKQIPPLSPMCLQGLGLEKRLASWVQEEGAAEMWRGKETFRDKKTIEREQKTTKFPFQKRTLLYCYLKTFNSLIN